jgi:cobalt-zinc-cadmium efflux system outer membrane protein
MRTYLQAAARREQVSILVQSRGPLVALRDSLRSRASAGDASGYDLTRIEVELSSLDAWISAAKRDLMESQLALGMLAGAPGARLDASDDLSVQDLAVAPSSPASPSDAVTLAAARARVSQHSFAVAAADRGWVPSLTLIGGAKTAPVPGGTAWGYVAGVALTLPIFDNGQADEQMSEAALRRARADLLATEHETKARVAMARERFRSSLQQAKTFESEQLPRLAQLLRRAEAAYREGERPVFELLDAHRIDRELRQRNVQLKLQARLGQVELLAALGRQLGGNP